MRRRLQGRKIFLVLAALSIFLLALGAAAWRLSEAPDVFLDEILYTRAGTRVAAEGQLVWDNGRPMAIHPPLYFLMEAVYLQVTGNPEAHLFTPGNIFEAVYEARVLNAIFAGLTALLFYWLGGRLHNRWLGLLLALLFMLDPFGLRTNRRAMLETSSALLMMAGMGFILVGMARGDGRLSPRRGLAGGVLLGLGLLAKDLVFTAPLALFFFGVWEWWRQRRLPGRTALRIGAPFFLATVIAALTALLVPLWALLAGHWSRFLDVKLLALQRLTGIIHLTGWNRPGVSLLDPLLDRLLDYGSTYLLLALGGVAILLLIRTWRHSAVGRLLSVWGLILYPFYAFVALFGSGSDQYFYYLLLPAILVVGYTLTVVVPALQEQKQGRLVPVARPWLQALLVGSLLLTVLPYNLSRWILNYGVGDDNGYYRLADYVDQNLPPEATLNASGDRLKYTYFFPGRPVAHAATPQEAQALDLHYFVLAPKDVEARYGRTTPELAAWLVARGRRLFSYTGDSYGPMFLYRVDDVAAGAEAEPALPEDAVATLDVQPAEGAPVALFLALLGRGACFWQRWPGCWDNLSPYRSRPAWR
jgi:4-amino-4-deoxy-L-arabinose transferase-like glycosyltransferase